MTSLTPAQWLACAEGTQAVCRCDVFTVQGGEEKLCAVAQGTVVAMSARG